MAPRAERRTDALTRARIVAAAVALLDEAGEGGLTVRALTERLATGAGAVYWHVANKGELLAAATDAVVAAALDAGPDGDAPRDRVRAVALGLFDAVDEHPWLAPQLATQLAGAGWRSTTPRIVESFGGSVRALGVPDENLFTATFALVYYVLGAAGQNAANGRAGSDVDRARFLDAAASTWEALDPDEYPVTRTVARLLRDHDDRGEFLAGVDLVLAGLTALHG